MIIKTERRGWQRGVALAATCALLLSACGTDDDTPGAADTTDETPADDGTGDDGATDDGATEGDGAADDDGAAANDGEPLRIAIVTSEAGPYASIGQQSLNVGQFAEEWYSERGGVDGRTVEVVTIDDQGTPEGAVEGMERAILQENAPFITGTVASSQALAMAAQIEGMGGIYISGINKTNALTGSECNPRVFRANANDAMDLATVGPWLDGRSEQTWSAIGADYEWGHDSVGSFVEQAEQRGMEVIGQHFPALGETDYGPYISSVQNEDPDGMWVSVSGADSVNLIQQAEPFGLFDDRVTIGNNFITDSGIESVGELAEALWGTVNYHHSIEAGMNQEFVEAWREMYDEDPTNFEGEVFMAFQMFAAGVEEAGSVEVEAVASAMNDLELETILGPSTIRGADGQLLRPNYLGQVVALEDGYGFEIESEVSAEEVSPEPSAECTNR